MMIEPQFLIIGGVAAVVGVLALVSLAQQRRRRAAYEEFSLVRGFNEGRRRTWGYTISGTKNQTPFIAFEYQWVTGSGKNTPEIRRFFEASPDHHVAGGGRFLFWWRGRQLPSAGELDEWLEQGDHVRRRFFKS
jgi:hypothetical protein